MNINDLIAIVKKKLKDEIVIEKIDIEDKTYLHKNHSGYQDGKFHLKLKISSTELKKLNQIDSNRRVFKILDQEVKEYIHSLQILIN
jgi:BolA protein